jgi:hypothetical protein
MPSSSIGLEIRPQSALLFLVPSFPLQTILPSDLAVCDSPLHTVIAIGALFLNLKGAKLPLLSAAGYHIRPGT